MSCCAKIIFADDSFVQLVFKLVPITSKIKYTIPPIYINKKQRIIWSFIRIPSMSISFDSFLIYKKNTTGTIEIQSSFRNNCTNAITKSAKTYSTFFLIPIFFSFSVLVFTSFLVSEGKPKNHCVHWNFEVMLVIAVIEKESCFCLKS